MRQLKAICIFK